VRSDARLGFADSRTRAAAAESDLEPSPATGDGAWTTGVLEPSAAPLDVTPSPAPTVATPLSPISARQTVRVEVAGEVRAVRGESSSSTLGVRVPPRLVEGERAGDVLANSHEPSVRSPDRTPSEETTSVRHSERVAAPAREPALLIQEAAAGSPPRPAPLVPLTTRSTAGGMHASPHDEPNEVHIHIGRIEVTAVHESATPRRPAGAPTAPPMSLQEYFAKRGRT
jgi:hypothetical protein